MYNDVGTALEHEAQCMDVCLEPFDFKRAKDTLVVIGKALDVNLDI